MQYFWSFLGHGGFKLLILAFIVIGNFAKMRAKESKKRDDQLRGKTTISDSSVPETAPDSTAKPAPPISQSISKSSSAPPDSPWSNNQNPFN